MAMATGEIGNACRRLRGALFGAGIVLLALSFAGSPLYAQTTAGPRDTPSDSIVCPLGPEPGPEGRGPVQTGGTNRTEGATPVPTFGCPPIQDGSISATPTRCNIDQSSGNCSANISWTASGTTAVQINQRNLVTGSSIVFASAGSGSGSKLATGITAQTLRFELYLDGSFWDLVEVVGNPGPSVSLSAPLAGEVVTTNVGSTLTASASDADGVSKVEFFDGATLIGTDTSAPYSVTWAPTVLGSHTISARATDSKGAVTTSVAALVTVATVKLSATNKVVNSTVAFGSTASATFRLASAGKIRFQTTDGGLYVEQSPFDEWLEPESATTGGNFEVLATGGPVTTGTLGQWLSLGTPRDWILTRSSAGTSQSTLSVQIRKSGSATVLTSTNVTLSATVTAPPNGAPVVNLTAPTNGQVFSAPATIPLVATATDADGTIGKVEFFQGGSATPIATATTAPYGGNWFNVPAGTYSVTAKATDNGGLATTSTAVSVIVNAAPTVSLAAVPTQTVAAGSTCTFALSATASDSDGSIGQVQFFNGTTALPGTPGNPNPDTTAPYAYTWSNVAVGTYTLSAKATDNRGAVTSSVSQSAVCNAAPTVNITAPAPGSTQPTSVTLTASAGDSDGSVTGVQYFEGTTPINTVLVSTAPYTYTWSPVTVGSHTVTAKALDNRNAVGTSSPVTFTVANLPPTATLIAPLANTSYTRPSGPTLTATVSTSAGSITLVEFLDNGVVIGSDTAPNAQGQYTYPSDSTSWNTTSVAAGSHSLSARASNSLGTVGPLSAAVPITLLNPLPAVNLTAPVNGSSVDEGASVTLSANASIALGTITQVEFFDGAVRIGDPDTSAPYSVPWTAQGVGGHSLTAKATSSLGTTKVSAPITITVSNPAPSVTLTAPSAGVSLPVSQEVVLSADASDSNGTVSQVEFFDGSTSLGVSPSTGSPYTLPWTPTLTGTYNLSAQATDNGGASTSTPAITIAVTEPVMCFVLPTKPGSVP